MTEPRIPPLTIEQFEELVAAGVIEPAPVGDGRVPNIERLWAHHPDLVAGQRSYQAHWVQGSQLPRRDQELAILRVAWLCRCEYEFGQHVRLSRRHGVDEEDTVRVLAGPAAAGWSDCERLLLEAVDELLDSSTISDRVWDGLAQQYSAPQLLDFLSVVGRYWTVAVVANSVRLPREDGTPGFPRRVQNT